MRPCAPCSWSGRQENQTHAVLPDDYGPQLRRDPARTRFHAVRRRSTRSPRRRSGSRARTSSSPAPSPTRTRRNFSRRDGRRPSRIFVRNSRSNNRLRIRPRARWPTLERDAYHSFSATGCACRRTGKRAGRGPWRGAGRYRRRLRVPVLGLGAVLGALVLSASVLLLPVARRRGARTGDLHRAGRCGEQRAARDSGSW